ncbi:MAG: hypothetical protein IK151_07805 [Erysipelotrichaceae bacterium]|nr:hypothetical protein [Erysipelotrichaceae bacterium]
MSELTVYLKPLILTIIFEGIGAYILGLRTRKELLFTVLVNIITNPPLVCFSLFLMYHLGIEKGTIITYAVLEPLVVYVEYLLYKNYLSVKNSFALSLTLNIISVIGGLLCQKIF